MQTRAAIVGLLLAVALVAGALGCGSMKQLLSLEPEPKPEFGSPDSTGLVIVDCVFPYDDMPGMHITNKKSFFDEVMDEIRDDRPRFRVLGGKIIDSEGKIIKGKRISDSPGAVVFFAVPPGQYRLEEFAAKNNLNVDEKQQWYNCENEIYCPDGIIYKHKNLSVRFDTIELDVEPGQITYIGKLELLEWHAPPYGDTWHESADGDKWYDSSVTNHWDYHEHNQSTDLDGSSGQAYAHKYEHEYELEALEKVLKLDKSNPWNPRLAERMQAVEAYMEK